MADLVRLPLFGCQLDGNLALIEVDPGIERPGIITPCPDGLGLARFAGQVA